MPHDMDKLIFQGAYFSRHAYVLLFCVYMSFYVCALVSLVKMKSFWDL